MRKFTARRSSSLIPTQRVISSKVRKQLRHTSSPSAVEQCPVQGVSALISAEGENRRCMARLYRLRRLFQPRQPDQRLLARLAAHLGGRLQPAAEGRACGLAEHLAAQLVIELNARHPGGLAVRHAGQGRGDGGGDAAGGAVGTAGHVCIIVPPVYCRQMTSAGLLLNRTIKRILYRT